MIPYCPHIDARERDSAWRAAARLLGAEGRLELATLLDCPWRLPLRDSGSRVAWHLRRARLYRHARAAGFARDGIHYARLERQSWHRGGGGVPR